MCNCSFRLRRGSGHESAVTRAERRSANPVAPPLTFAPRTLLFAVLLGVLGCAAPAEAHKVFIFATVRGRLIEGQVYYQGGDPAQDLTITILDQDDRELGKTVSDQLGKFAFEPRFRGDHKLVANAGLGHKAVHVVPAEELPSDLPASAQEAGPGEAVPAATTGTDRHPSHADSVSGDEVAIQIESLSQQIAGLRMDLDKSRAQLRYQDVLGGLGYILGITGLVFYLLGARRKEKQVVTGR